MDWNLPSLSQAWANFLAAIKGRDESNAKMDYSADTNIPDGTIRWSSTNNRFEKWEASGLSWGVLSSRYLINVDDADTVDGVDLPGTIAQVLTDHTKAAHDALNIDANTLDGINSSQFLRADANDTTSGSLTAEGSVTSEGTLYIGPAAGANSRVNIRLLDNPSPTKWARGLEVHKGGTMAFGVGLLGVGSAVSAGYIGTGVAPWGNGINIYPDGTLLSEPGGKELWHAGNDGIGSGLNADMLDGFHLSGLFGTVTSPARSNGVTYTNSHGRPMMVVAMRGSDSELLIVVDGVTIKAQGNNNGDQACVTVIVPSGSNYSFANMSSVVEIY